MKNSATKGSRIVAEIPTPNSNKDSKIKTLPPIPKLQKVVEPPFPVHVYPKPIQDMLKEMQVKQGLSIDLSATALLSFIGAAVGAKVRLRASGTWISPLCIWTIIVAESGARKSPILKFFEKPFASIERGYERQYRIELGEYKTAMQAFEKGMPLPIEPARKDIVIKKGSFEAFDEALCKNPHGILFLRQEITGFLESINKYSKGDDGETLLEYFDGDGLKTNYRKGRSYIDFSNICITGSTQPSKVSLFMREGRDTDGTAFRFLYVYKDVKKPERIYKEGIPYETEKFYHRLITNLHDIPFTEFEQPNIVDFCPDAWQTFETWYIEQSKRYNATTDAFERGMMSKFEGITLRLALVLELLTRQCSDIEKVINPAEICVTEKSFKGAIELIEFFQFMAAKIQGHVHNNPLSTKSKNKYNINWVDVFGGREQMQRKDLVEALTLNYNVAPRTADGILKDELYWVRSGVYSLFSPTAQD